MLIYFFMLMIPWLGVSYCCSLCGVFLGVGKECVRSFVPLRRHYHHRTLLQSGTLSPVDVTSLFLLFTASIASIIKVTRIAWLWVAIFPRSVPVGGFSAITFCVEPHIYFFPELKRLKSWSSVEVIEVMMKVVGERTMLQVWFRAPAAAVSSADVPPGVWGRHRKLP